MSIHLVRTQSQKNSVTRGTQVLQTRSSMPTWLAATARVSCSLQPRLSTYPRPWPRRRLSLWTWGPVVAAPRPLWLFQVMDPAASWFPAYRRLGQSSLSIRQPRNTWITLRKWFIFYLTMNFSYFIQFTFIIIRN